MDFAENLKTMRTIRKFTQAKLADKAMTSQAFISHIESGKMLPTPSLKRRLREALGWGEYEDKAFEILDWQKATGQLPQEQEPV